MLLLILIMLVGAVLVVMALVLRGISERASTNNIQVELRGILERVSTIEQNQNQASQGIATSNTNLAVIDTMAKNLIGNTDAIRQELERAKNDLTALQARTEARQELELRTADSIRRLEMIIAGTQTKGTAGENILEVMLAKLPLEWQVRNFTVGNKTVEFGLRLPNDLILPIDSKWTATQLLEQFLKCEDTTDKQKLKLQIENAVKDRAKDVQKYIDPNVTVNFGIVAMPDAVFDLCYGIHIDIFQLNVVLVSYSLFVPYLLLVFQTIRKTSQALDVEKLGAYLQSAEHSIRALQEELHGRLSKAIVMQTNSRDAMSGHLNKISSGLTGFGIRAGVEDSVEVMAQANFVDET